MDEPQAEACGLARPVGTARVGVLPKELRHALGRHAPALVGDRDRDLEPPAHRGDVDGRGRRRVARGIGKQVAEHLHDAPLVGHHRRQVPGQVDAHRLARAPALERGPRLFHQLRHLPRLGLDRELPCVDAPRVEQVADEVVHPVRLLVDDAVELAKLRAVERARGAKQRRRRALDGDERPAKLVAHHGEELRAQPFELFQCR